MTSNVGASSIVDKSKSAIGFNFENNANESDRENVKTKVMSHLRDTFRPEFLNRVDEIIVFNKLSDEDIRKIAKIMLGEIKKRIADLNIEIEFSDEVVDMLAKEGFDPVYGARPLRREIQRRIEDSFSTVMLEGEFAAGDIIEAALDNNEIKYIKK